MTMVFQVPSILHFSNHQVLGLVLMEVGKDGTWLPLRSRFRCHAHLQFASSKSGGVCSPQTSVSIWEKKAARQRCLMDSCKPICGCSVPQGVRFWPLFLHLREVQEACKALMLMLSFVGFVRRNLHS